MWGLRRAPSLSADALALGTTKDAFFWLDRLAAFLRTAPLDLKLALNLDGGPVACQAIAFNGFQSDFLRSVGNGHRRRRAEAAQAGVRKPPMGLAIVLAVVPR